MPAATSAANGFRPNPQEFAKRVGPRTKAILIGYPNNPTGAVPTRQELEGIASRTDYDLKQHHKFSGKDLSYFDEERKERFVPHVVEPSAGADRARWAAVSRPT